MSESINIWEWMHQNPWLAFFLALMLVALVSNIIYLPFKCWNRYMRHLNIRAQGWPPPHVDADGDPVTKEDES